MLEEMPATRSRKRPPGSVPGALFPVTEGGKLVVDEFAFRRGFAVFFEEDQFVFAVGVEPWLGQVVTHLWGDTFAGGRGNEIAADVVAVEVNLTFGQAVGFEPEGDIGGFNGESGPIPAGGGTGLFGEGGVVGVVRHLPAGIGPSGG